MSVRDIRSNLAFTVIATATIAADGDTLSSVFDSADYDLGVMFPLVVTDYTDGDLQMFIEHSEDNVTFEDIAPEMYIGDQSYLSSANTVEGGETFSLGCFATKRYLRVRITATNVTTGATATTYAIAKGETLPNTYTLNP